MAASDGNGVGFALAGKAFDGNGVGFALAGKA